jgi:plastocyanin
MRLIASIVAATLLAVSAPLFGAPPAAAATHSITISGYAFAPAAMTITAGDTVTWTNEDQAPHDVTTTSAPAAIHGATMGKGQSWSYTFTTPGRYSYICSIHPDMTATLTVVAAPSTHAAPAPRTRTIVRRVAAQPAVVRPRSPAASSPSSSAPPTVASEAAPADPAAAERPLRPLLIVAGIIAAVTTLCLLMLASRPEPG